LLATELAGRGASVTIIDADPNQPVTRWSRKPPRRCERGYYAAATDMKPASQVRYARLKARRVMRFFLLMGVLSACLMTGSVQAQAYMALGPGTRSCGTWTKDRRDDPTAALMHASWVLGFLSGIGYIGIDDP
jgi:hypothetical protein